MEQKQALKTFPVKVGKLIIGGGHPVSVQTMWKSPLKCINPELITEINSLFEAGCDLLRFAVPDREAAELLGQLSQTLSHPLVADIHFDYKLALRCLDFPLAKIRINPGNIGAPWKVLEVIKKAADKDIPLRVGVNSGSLPKILHTEADTALAMVKAAETEMEILEQAGFRNTIFSLKSSDIETTIRANRIFAAKYPYPLHLGVTEAGPLIRGIVKTTIVLYTLLQEKIGDTLRVSLSDSPLQEILAGRQLLNTITSQGVNLISCPTCGRACFDVKGFVKKLALPLNKLQKNITVAIMGCPVNGPGEAGHADLGITGSGGQVILFKKGEIIARIQNEAEASKRFLEELEEL